MTIEEDILERITPNREEAKMLDEVMSTLIEKVQTTSKAYGIDIKVEPVGSVTKGTHLKDHDADIFMLFPTDVPREDMDRIGLEIGRAVLNETREKYAEHPYINGRYIDLDVDLVPSYFIKSISEMKTAVDRTPFHTTYVKEHLNEGQKDQVRLLKRFMKGIGAYGADAKTQGFSGYLCELLVMKYGSFRGVLEAAGGWSHNIRLFLEGASYDKTFDDNFVFIDPVDPDRNVAAAVSPAMLGLFIFASGEYLKSPKTEFFFPNHQKPMPREELHGIMDERGTKFILITLKNPLDNDDVIYPQARKAMNSIKKAFKNHDFNVMGQCMSLGEQIYILFELETTELPEAKRHNGPFAWNERAKDFLDKWIGNKKAISGPYLTDEGVWAVDIKRKYTFPEEMITQEILGLNLGKALNESVKEEFNVYCDEDILAMERSLISEYLSKKRTWEY